MMAQQQQQQADQLIHNHALFPEVLDALRRCEVAGLNTASAAELGLAGGAPAPSSSSNNIPSSALPPLPSHFGGDGSDRSDSTDDYVIKYIELQRQHAAQLEKVYDLCDQFSSRYLTLLKEGAQRFTTTVNAAQEGGGGKRKGDALDSEANKKRRGNLPKRATNILKKWLFEHLFHPYPSEEQKRQLASQTGLTINQISNWFINARRRILQPMLETVRQQQQQLGYGGPGEGRDPNDAMHQLEGEDDLQNEWSTGERAGVPISSIVCADDSDRAARERMDDAARGIVQ